MKLGFYPGCSLLGSSREYAESLRAIAPLLDLDLVDVPDWNCCGASAAHSLNHDLAAALPARILALAEQAGLAELLVPCSACFSRLGQTARAIADDADLRRRLADVIELPLAGRVRVLSVLEVLGRATSAADFPGRLRAPFAHKAACYYGCYLTRPAAHSVCARPEDPQEMDEIIRALGGTPLDWAFKVECCGAGLSVPRLDLVADLSGRIVVDAVARGADVLIVACPLCQTNLDLRRNVINAAHRAAYDIPVLYLSQAVGLALGLSPRVLGLHRHAVPVRLATPALTASGVAKES